MVVAKTVENGPPGPEVTSDGVFVGIQVCVYKTVCGIGIKHLIKQNIVWKHFKDTSINEANKYETHATKNLVLNIFD